MLLSFSTPGFTDDTPKRGGILTYMIPADSPPSFDGHREATFASAYAAKKASLANVRAAQAEFMPKFFLSTTGTYSSGNLNVTSLPSGGQQRSTSTAVTSAAVFSPG
jgi:outer membrane protein TolC